VSRLATLDRGWYRSTSSYAVVEEHAVALILRGIATTRTPVDSGLPPPPAG